MKTHKTWLARLAALALIAPAAVAAGCGDDTSTGSQSSAMGNETDVAFINDMTAHHQGAIDMAKVALEHGDDPEIRALAEEVIAAQEAEIKMMQEWLKKNGHSQ